MPSTVQFLAEKIIGTSGEDYWTGYRVLKHYVKKLDIDQLVAEIKAIDNPDVSRYLMAVGLPMEAIDALTERVKELR